MLMNTKILMEMENSILFLQMIKINRLEFQLQKMALKIL